MEHDNTHDQEHQRLLDQANKLVHDMLDEKLAYEYVKSCGGFNNIRKAKLPISMEDAIKALLHNKTGSCGKAIWRNIMADTHDTFRSYCKENKELLQRRLAADVTTSTTSLPRHSGNNTSTIGGPTQRQMRIAEAMNRSDVSQLTRSTAIATQSGTHSSPPPPTKHQTPPQTPGSPSQLPSTSSPITPVAAHNPGPRVFSKQPPPVRHDDDDDDDDDDGGDANNTTQLDELLMEMFFSADSSRLCGITSNSLATVWDVRTGRKVGKPFKTCEESWREFHSGSGAWTVFSPDGRTLLDGRGPYWLWDVETGTRRTNSIDHNDKIFAMVFSPDSKRVVTTAGADERCARVWDAQTGKPLTKPLHHHFSVFTAKFLPDGRRFVTTCLDNEARIWDSTNGKLLAVFANPEAEEPLAAFSPDGQYLFTSGGKVARIWSTTTGQMLVKPIEFSAEVKAATFGADSKSLQTVTETRLVQIWDFRN